MRAPKNKNAVVWAKQQGFPWWPCTRITSPNKAQLKLPRGAGQTAFVQFCGDKHEVAWVREADLHDWELHFPRHSKSSKKGQFLAALKEANALSPPPAAGRGAFNAGDRVEGKYSSGVWYPATITAVHPDGFTVDWDDGDESKRRRPTSGVRAMRTHVPAPTALAKRKMKLERDAKADADGTPPPAITTPRASVRRQQIIPDAPEAAESPPEAPVAAGENALPEPSSKFGDSSGLSEYELDRLKLIQDNERMLLSLGLASSSTFMGGGGGGGGGGGKVRKASGIGARPIKRGPVVKRKRGVEEPTRRSSRQRNEAAADVYVTSDSSRTITVGGSGKDALIKLGAAAAVDNAVSWGREDRLPEEVLTLESTGGTEQYGSDFFETLRTLSGAVDKKRGQVQKAALGTDVLDYAERLSKMTIGEGGLAKVVPERVYSLAVHPSEQNVMVAAGDKQGNLGLWNVDDGDAGIVNYRPHTGVINRLQYHPTDSTKLFTTSYDGTVRCLDITQGAFDFVASTQRGNDSWLQYSTVDPTGNGVLMCESAGIAKSFDRRANETVWEMQLHEKKINTIDCHPLEPHYFATASLDKSVKIWDARRLKSNHTGEVGAVAELPDTRSINCAKYSPSGSRLLTVSMSHHLFLYVDAQKKTGAVDPDSTVYHDNKTGRWLSVFHANWDPKTDHAFVIGSMTQPRQAEVYTAEGDNIRRVMSLQDPEWMASVQSRCDFHPSLDVVVCANASGKVHVFR